MTAQAAPPLALLVAATAIGPVGLHILVPSVPGLAKVFGADHATAQLALTAYLVAIGLAQPVYGPLSDRYGRRPALLAGLAAFLLGTLACGLASTIEELIAGRFLQGVGGCAGMVIGRAIVRDVHERDRSASVIAHITMVMVLAPALAPAIGSHIEIWFGWRADFVLLGIVGAVITGFAWLLLAETNRSPGATTARALLHQHLRLLRSRAFLGYTAASASSIAAWYAFIAGAPHVLVNQLGFDPTAYGRLILIVMGAYMLGNFAASRLSERLGADRMILVGIAFSLTAMVPLIAGNWRAPHELALFLPMALCTFGNGISQPNGIAAGLSVDPRIAGTASGLMGCLQMGAAAITTMAVGFVQDATPRPMIAVIAVTTLLGLLAALAARAAPRRG